MAKNDKMRARHALRAYAAAMTIVSTTAVTKSIPDPRECYPDRVHAAEKDMVNWSDRDTATLEKAGNLVALSSACATRAGGSDRSSFILLTAKASETKARVLRNLGQDFEGEANMALVLYQFISNYEFTSAADRAFAKKQVTLMKSGAF